MTYRGEDEALRARVGELERKLAQADAEIAVLRGRAPVATPGTTIERSAVSGGPSRYVREVSLPYGVSERGYERIAELLRARLGLNASQVGRTLSVPRRFSLVRDESGTRIRLEADWSSVSAGVISVGVLSTFFGGLFTTGIVADLMVHVGHGAGIAAIAIGATTALATATASTWMTRRRTARRTTEDLAAHEGTFAAILAIADEHAERTAPTRVAEDAGAVEPEDEAAAPEHARAAAVPR